jgi:Tfp pilus assembly protein PilF
LAALTVAVLWAVHPLQTEAVTYVAQRAESLMGLLYLLTLYCFIRGSHGTNRARNWFALSFFCCLAGMASKEVMVTAPLVVLLYDRTFAAGSFREAWRQRKRVYLGLASTWLLLAGLVAGTGGNRGGTVGFGVNVAWWAYPATQFRAVARYLALAFWPHPLVFDYGTFWVSHAAEIVPGALVVAPLALGTLAALRRRPALGFLGAWFFLILAPTSLAPGTIQMIVEHRMYLPIIAVIAPTVLLFFRVAGTRASIPLFVLLAALLGWTTFRRNADYRSNESIWRDTVGKAPGNAGAHNNLGAILFASRQDREAAEQYKEAIRISPNYADAHTNLGDLLQRSGDLDGAMSEYYLALRLQPDDDRAHNDLGTAFLKLGKVREAREQFETALRLNPNLAEGHFNLGDVLVHGGRPSDAAGEYEKALQLKPDFPEARDSYGSLLARAGRMKQAEEQFEEALRLNPDFAEARFNYGNALARASRWTEAIGQYDRALRIKPDYAEARINRGNALAQAGRTEEAVSEYRRALEASPRSGEARTDLGNALLALGRSSEAESEYRRALQIAPASATTHYCLGNALALQGRFGEAALQFEEALRLQPNYPDARAHLEAAKSMAAQK